MESAEVAAYAAALERESFLLTEDGFLTPPSPEMARAIADAAMPFMIDWLFSKYALYYRLASGTPLVPNRFGGPMAPEEIRGAVAALERAWAQRERLPRDQVEEAEIPDEFVVDVRDMTGWAEEIIELATRGCTVRITRGEQTLATIVPGA